MGQEESVIVLRTKADTVIVNALMIQVATEVLEAVVLVQGPVPKDSIKKLRRGDGMIIPPLAVKDVQQDKENHTDAIGRIIAMDIHVLLEIAMII